MSIRTIARESRLALALEGLSQSRSRSKEMPATLVERQPRDRRTRARDSTKPVAVIATVKAISEGKGVRGANMAATGSESGGYISPGGDFGGGQAN